MCLLLPQESKKSEESGGGRRVEEGRRGEEARVGQLEGSVEWTTGENEEVTESHLSISAKYISDDQVHMVALGRELGTYRNMRGGI